MARRKSPWNGFKTCILLLVFLLFFTVLPIATSIFASSLAFVIQYTPLFSMTTIFALLLATLVRLQFITEVPQKTLGVLVDRSGGFKAVLPPARYWIKFYSERIQTYLSLEPTTAQVPLLKLKASDGDVPPQVVIIGWQVRAELSQLLYGPYGSQAQTIAVISQQKREQLVCDAVEVAIRRYLQQRTISQVQAEIADSLGRPLQDAVTLQANRQLKKVGLQVDQIELVGAAFTASQAAAAPSQNAGEARKLLVEAQRKLKLVLRPAAPPITPQHVAQSAWQAHQSASQARNDINEISDTMNRYVAAVRDAFVPLYHQARQRPDLMPLEQARQETFARLNRLQQHVGELGQYLIALDQQARRLPSAPFDLTPAECAMLFEVLDAIERKKITLDSL